jgi:hypothetical protein
MAGNQNLLNDGIGEGQRQSGDQRFFQLAPRLTDLLAAYK